MTEEKNLNQNNQGQKNREARLEEYRDLGGVSLEKLNRGLWLIEHRQQLRFILVCFLSLVGAISCAYSIYGFAYYIAKGMKEDELLAREIVLSTAASHEYINQISPRELRASSPKIFKTVVADGAKTETKYDFLVAIKNPNERHWGEFEYYFSAGDKKIGPAKGFVMPGESKYLVSLANKLDFVPANVKLTFDNFRWGRVNRHDIGNWEEYYNDHLDIAVEKKDFKTARSSGLSEVLNLNNLEFEVANRTAYSYWNVDFVILLWSGDSIVGVNKYSLPKLMTSTRRTAEISWPGIFSRIDKIDVAPEINIMKNDIYIDYEGGVGEQK